MDTIRLIQEATEAVARWPRYVRDAVLAARPEPVEDRYSTLEWMTTVDVFRQPGEDLVTCAERLALYLTVHAERWDSTPTLARVQRTAAEAALARQTIQENTA
jgi:hypothetical protein